MDFARPRQPCGGDAHQQPYQRDRQQDAGNRPRRGEQQAFHHHQASQSQSRGAKRRSHRKLPLAIDRPAHVEVRHIDAGDH